MKTGSKLNEYFQFTRKDRIAATIIALILLTAFLLPPILEQRRTTSPAPLADTAWMTALHQLEKPSSGKGEPPYPKGDEKKYYEKYTRDRAADGYNNDGGNDLFNFDPNRLDAAGWQRLGIREKTIATILKFREKGGKFRKPEDLLKIYGLPPAQFERLRPYINIGEQLAAGPGSFTPGERPAKPFTWETKTVDINTGDSVAFEALPGIGSKLAVRIIRFREKLGGFYSIEQVKETFGLADSTFQKIKPFLILPDAAQIKTIDINKAGADELGNHPYIRYNLAKIIIQYRNQHGPFTTVDELKKIDALDKTIFEKMKPYLIATK